MAGNIAAKTVPYRRRDTGRDGGRNRNKNADTGSGRRQEHGEKRSENRSRSTREGFFGQRKERRNKGRKVEEA